ncbi:hypothetical protein VTJ49DRAFT_82 [Mycothermus thermophilus]|uniref:Uncharacterized protein n=1 Tax=Humicola insolens TaxID=85995 RepID=A0ABR3VRW2_HUMIN
MASQAGLRTRHRAGPQGPATLDEFLKRNNAIFIRKKPQAQKQNRWSHEPSIVLSQVSPYPSSPKVPSFGQFIYERQLNCVLQNGSKKYEVNIEEGERVELSLECNSSFWVLPAPQEGSEANVDSDGLPMNRAALDYYNLFLLTAKHGGLGMLQGPCTWEFYVTADKKHPSHLAIKATCWRDFEQLRREKLSIPLLVERKQHLILNVDIAELDRDSPGAGREQTDFLTGRADRRRDRLLKEKVRARRSESASSVIANSTLTSEVENGIEDTPTMGWSCEESEAQVEKDEVKEAIGKTEARRKFKKKGIAVVIKKKRGIRLGGETQVEEHTGMKAGLKGGNVSFHKNHNDAEEPKGNETDHLSDDSSSPPITRRFRRQALRVPLGTKRPAAALSSSSSPERREPAARRRRVEKDPEEKEEDKPASDRSIRSKVTKDVLVNVEPIDDKTIKKEVVEEGPIEEEGFTVQDVDDKPPKPHLHARDHRGNDQNLANQVHQAPPHRLRASHPGVPQQDISLQLTAREALQQANARAQVLRNQAHQSLGILDQVSQQQPLQNPPLQEQLREILLRQPYPPPLVARQDSSQRVVHGSFTPGISSQWPGQQSSLQQAHLQPGLVPHHNPEQFAPAQFFQYPPAPQFAQQPFWQGPLQQPVLPVLRPHGYSQQPGQQYLAQQHPYYLPDIVQEQPRVAAQDVYNHVTPIDRNNFWQIVGLEQSRQQQAPHQQVAQQQPAPQGSIQQVPQQPLGEQQPFAQSTGTDRSTPQGQQPRLPPLRDSMQHGGLP